VAARVLIIGAGSAAGENLIRSLWAGDPALVLVGCNEDRFVLRRSTANAHYLVPSPRSREFIGALRRLIDDTGIDLIVPTNDAHVRALSDGRARLRSRVFLPPPAVIEIATNSPVTMVPISTPPSALTPAPGPISQFMANATTIGTSTEAAMAAPGTLPTSSSP